LRTVVADGNGQRFSLPDQHEQPLATRDLGVDQVTLGQHVVLHGQWDHHCRKIGPVRLVDRYRISEANLVQFPEVILHQPVIEADRQLLIDCVDTLDDSDVPVEHILGVIVLCLDHLVANLESPAEPFDGWLARSDWIQNPLKGFVQLTKEGLVRSAILNTAIRPVVIVLLDSATDRLPRFQYVAIFRLVYAAKSHLQSIGRDEPQPCSPAFDGLSAFVRHCP